MTKGKLKFNNILKTIIIGTLLSIWDERCENKRTDILFLVININNINNFQNISFVRKKIFYISFKIITENNNNANNKIKSNISFRILI